MALRDRFKSQSHGEKTGYETLQLSPQDVASLSGAVDEIPREAIVVRPHKDNNGIPAMEEALESLYTTDTKSPRFSQKTVNVAPAHAFEMRYARERSVSNERVVSLQYLAGSDREDGKLEQQLEHRYPNSILERRTPAFLDADEGQYVAGATLALRRYTLYPIRAMNLDGFNSDPTGSIIQQMVSQSSQTKMTADADVIVQIMFKPALRDWIQGVENGEGIITNAGTQTADSTVIEGTPSVSDLIYNLKEPTLEKRRNDILIWKKELIEHDPSPRDLAVAKMLDEQDGKAWRLYFRIFAISDDPEVAIDRASSTAGMFRNYYEYRGEQSLLPQPFGRKQLRKQLPAGARRDWEDTGIVKTQNEVAGLVNPPSADDVSSSRMRWTLTKPGDGVPPGTPRFDYEEHGVVDATPEEQQIAMFDLGGPDSTIWVGRGSKHGVEAGIDPDQLDTHMLIGGRTGTGKSTFVEHNTSQLTEQVAVAANKAAQGYGGVINDPKGKDADDFIREWPEERREEDLIVMDLGEDPTGEPYENIPQYNFLEIPRGIDPDTRIGASMIEAMADAVAGLVADAGGTDNYIGSLMKRVTKTVCRGMLQSDRSVSLLDLACAVSSPEGLEQFSDWMDEERITFIRETARRQAETKTDDNLDPLAGRMEEWIHNRSVRDLICARDPTFSLYDLVEEGKWLVIRFPEWAGKTEKRLLSTSLILGTYFNKRACDNGDPFYLVCDEFDKIISKNSNLHVILSESRAHNYRCVLACQAPGNQFPKDHPIRDAIADNIKTHISFNPGGKENAKFVAQHHTVDVEDLMEIDDYYFYMRTETDHGQTDSYLVSGSEPIRDVRRRVTGKPGRSDEEVEKLKLRSMERYGAPPKSAEEQRAESYFTAGTPDSIEDSSSDSDRRELVETLCCKASYDEVLHETKAQYLNSLIDVVEEPDLFDTWVDVGQEKDEDGKPTGVYGRFHRYLRDVDPQAAENLHIGVFSSIVESLSELEIRVQEDETEQIRCTKDAPTRFKGSGDDRTRGGIAHGQILSEWYEHLTRLGLEVTIVEQTGDRDVDAIGRLRESLPELEQLHRGEITHRQFGPALERFKREHPLLYELTGGEDVTIEAEKSTTRSPGKTARNLSKAYERGEKCLFLTAPDRAHRVYNGLTDPPFVREDDGDRARLYHVRALSIGEETPLRPNTTEENYWYFEHETSDFVLMEGSDDDADELARFDSLDAIESSLDAYPEDTRSIDDALIGQNGDWREVKLPFSPRDTFGDDLPTDEDFEILSRDGDSLLCLLDDVLGPLNRLIDRGPYDPSDTEKQSEEPVSNEKQTSDTDDSSDGADSDDDDIVKDFEKLFQDDD